MPLFCRATPHTTACYLYLDQDGPTETQKKVNCYRYMSTSELLLRYRSLQDRTQSRKHKPPVASCRGNNAHSRHYSTTPSLASVHRCICRCIVHTLHTMNELVMNLINLTMRPRACRKERSKESGMAVREREIAPLPTPEPVSYVQQYTYSSTLYWYNTLKNNFASLYKATVYRCRVVCVHRVYKLETLTYAVLQQYCCWKSGDQPLYSL